MLSKACLTKKDAFALLPTGFGKSFTYLLPPLLLDEMEGGYHVSIVISPLKALIADQVSQLNRRNVKAIALMDTTKYADIDEDVSIIFASPESATLPKWKRLFMIKKKHICLLAFDEAHCISSWGLDFRPHYRQIAVLQSYCDVPNLVLTATATQKIQNDIYQVLGLSKSNTAVVAELPNM